MTNEFAVLILTHGRPDTVITDKTLRRQGYTGPIFYVIDNEDKTADRYRERYGDKVIEFDKKAYADQVDEGDNFDNRRTTTHVRNALFDIAERLGFEWFIQLDDDYDEFKFRTNAEEQYPSDQWTFKTKTNEVFDAVFEFFRNSPFTTVALAQGGDFIGGAECHFAEAPTIYRKCMNSFFCSTRRRFQFVGRLNEDVNTYCVHGSRGVLFGTIPLAALDQGQTQAQAGGMSNAYLDGGTYVKSFYTVMMCPSFVAVSSLNSKFARVHHRISWPNAVPVILEDKHASAAARKARNPATRKATRA
jgi:hypothetical protein